MRAPAALLVLIAAAGSVTGGEALAQPAAKGSAAAPPTASAATPPTVASASPSPETELPSALPPGHPPIGGAGAVPMTESGPRDDPAVPPGSIVVEVSGLAPDVLSTLEASLLSIRRNDNDVATDTIATARLDASGSARFEGLALPNADLLRVSIEYNEVPYASRVFRLSQQAGKTVPIRLFEVTTDIDRARIGVQAFAYLEPRDHHLHIEQMFRFANLSDRTWRTAMMPMRLPAGAEGLATVDESGPLRVHAVAGQGLVIQGVVPPGRAQVSFQYRLPYPDDEVARIALGMPPRVGAVRVMASAGPGLNLHVDGLAPAVPSRNDSGQRLLVTEGAVPPGGDQIETLQIALGGLPTASRARWIALALTVLAMAVGLVGAVRLRGPASLPARRETLDAQRASVLAAIADNEVELAKGRIDQDRYDVQRDLLLDELARLLSSSQTEPGNPKDHGDKHGDKT